MENLIKINEEGLKVNENIWKISYLAQDELIFKNNGSWKQDFIDSLENCILKSINCSSRFYFDYHSVPYILGVFPGERELYLSSSTMFYEINVMNAIENLEALSKELEDAYTHFKAHCEKILSISRDSMPTDVEGLLKEFDIPDFSKESTPEKVFERMKRTQQKINSNMGQYKKGLFEYFSDYALNLTADYSLVRIHLLKFFAILPSFDFPKSEKNVKDILLETLRRLIDDCKNFPKYSLPSGLLLVIKIKYFILKFIPPVPLSALVKFFVRFQAKRFIAGESMPLARKSMTQLLASGRDATLDQLGELTVSPEEADLYTRRVISVIDGLKEYINPGEKNKAGIYKAHVSIKVSALGHDIRPEDFDYSYQQVSPRLKEILLRARSEKVFINVDAEHYKYRDLVFRIYAKVLLETPGLESYEQTGTVLQTYLRDSIDHLREVIEFSKKRKIPMPLRVVKGAYWDAETVAAEAHNYLAPQFLNKTETDVCFRSCCWLILKNYPHVQLTVGSHNLDDHAFVHALHKEKFKSHPEIEHQCLHMTYEALSTAMEKSGFVVRNYIPVGDLIVGMAYLVRRIMENSSQVGVLTQMRQSKLSSEVSVTDKLRKQFEDKLLKRDPVLVKLDGNFSNYSSFRGYKKSHLDSIKNEIELIKKNVSDSSNQPDDQNSSVQKIYCNSNKSICLGEVELLTSDQARDKIDKFLSQELDQNWYSSFEVRVVCLLSAARELSRRRSELSALIILEAGKTLNEAYADVDEAIDFINYYCKSAANLSNRSDVSPIGIVGSITPWNFPIAIACGMITAPLIMGNRVLFKPAEQTPLIAKKLVEIFFNCGVPKDSLCFLIGMGETVGEEITKTPQLSGLVFTGSKEVGLMLFNKLRSQTIENKNLKKIIPKRVITEMGGKNAIVITDSAELDEAVEGVLYACFAHAGQKCSAASRIIIDNKVKKKFVRRLKKAALELKVGESDNFSTTINPLIDDDAKYTLMNHLKGVLAEASEHNGIVHVDRSHECPNLSAVGPVIVELPAERSYLKDSYSQIELFAPVIHILSYQSLDEALRMVNATDYALTFGIFCQSQDVIDYFLNNVESGNLYVNRPNTGARVAIEPFGGHKFSGTGPKAGGRDYLKSFAYFNYEFDITETNLEEGSDYDFDLCQKTVSSELHRFAVKQCLKQFINEFEEVFQGVFPKIKAIIEEFNRELCADSFDKLDNRKIPGQISYDDLTQAKSRSLFIIETEMISSHTIRSFFSALFAGVGINVCCRNQKSYEAMQRLAQLCYRNGIAKSQCDVYFSSQQRVDETLNKDIDVIVFETSEQRLSQYLSNMNLCNSNSMKALQGPLFGYCHDTAFDFIKNFIHVRSIAVNTMRHGAPLELE